MQLQAERDHFVHAGIGGGCSSPSSSSPEDSVLSHVKVKNLKKPKKPKAKSRDGDKEKDVRRDVGQLNSGASSTTKAKTAISPIVTEHRAFVMSDTEAADHPGEDLSRDTTATATTLPLARYIPLPPNYPAPVISAASAAKTMPTAPSAAPVSAILATTDTFLSKPVHMRIVSQHKETDLTASRQEDDIVVIPTALTKSRLTTKTTSDSLLPSATQTPAADYFSSLLQRTLTEPCLPVYESEAAASLTQVLGCDRLSRLPSELLFNILCRLDALDLSRMAQVNKFCGRMASDNGLWRVKSMQHSLYSKRHLQGRQGVMPWLAYYKFLHQKSLVVKQNWADARPQAVYVLEGHTGLVSSLEMSMWSLVTGSIDSTLRVWDLRTQNCLRVIRASQPLTCVSHSVKAGAACARTSFGGLCIWDIQTGELILQDDTAMPQIASFMYMDERYIGYGQTDGGVTVFDWSSRVALEVVGTYHAHDGDVIHISVLDHKYVLSVSTNGETLVYSLKLACIVEKILLPHAAQAIPFTPTIHGDKVMFSTRDAVYEYELLLDQLDSHHKQSQPCTTTTPSPPTNLPGRTTLDHRKGKVTSVPLTATCDQFVTPQPVRLDPHLQENSISNQGEPSGLRPPLSTRAAPSPGRVWKNSNSLLSQIRQRVSTGKAFDQERLIIPTRFPRLASLCCLPRTSRLLNHGTTSARDSYGVFMPSNCTRLHEMSVYTRATKQINQIHGPAVDAMLTEAIRNRFYTTMECNHHCAVVSSGSKVYVVSFLPPDV